MQKEKVIPSFYTEVRNGLNANKSYRLWLAGYEKDMASVRSLRKFRAVDLIEPPITLLAAYYASENMNKKEIRKTLDLTEERSHGWQTRVRVLDYVIRKFVIGELAECGNEVVGGGTLAPDSMIRWASFKNGNRLEIRENNMLSVSAAFGGFSTEFSRKAEDWMFCERVVVCNKHGEQVFQKRWKRPMTIVQRIGMLPKTMGFDSIAGVQERLKAVLSSMGWRQRFEWAFDRDCRIFAQMESETVTKSQA